MNSYKLLAALAMVLATAGWGVADHCGPRGCPECGCKTCVPTPETKKVKKHCWEVDCKDVCIPKFKWPWEPCCSEPRCGRVRSVKVLIKKEYECEECGYKWTVQCVDDCGPAIGKGDGPVQHGASLPSRSPNADYQTPAPVRFAELP